MKDDKIITPLERLAIQLHDFLWMNTGEDGALDISGIDDATADEMIDLLNELQAEIKKRGLATFDYSITPENE